LRQATLVQVKASSSLAGVARLARAVMQLEHERGGGQGASATVGSPRSSRQGITADEKPTRHVAGGKCPRFAPGEGEVPPNLRSRMSAGGIAGVASCCVLSDMADSASNNVCHIGHYCAPGTCH